MRREASRAPGCRGGHAITPRSASRVLSIRRSVVPHASTFAAPQPAVIAARWRPSPRRSAAAARAKPMPETLLEITSLQTYFDVEEGTIRAVDGVSYKLLAGETLGLVG